MKPRSYFASAFPCNPPDAVRPAGDPAIASLSARHSPEWLKSGVIYQVFVRSSSSSGDLNGVRDEFLIAVNLSNAPFHGTVEAQANNWKEIELPVSKPEPAAVPMTSLNAFGVRIFENQAR